MCRTRLHAPPVNTHPFIGRSDGRSLAQATPLVVYAAYIGSIRKSHVYFIHDVESVLGP